MKRFFITTLIVVAVLVAALALTVALGERLPGSVLKIIF